MCIRDRDRQGIYHPDLSPHAVYPVPEVPPHKALDAPHHAAVPGLQGSGNPVSGADVYKRQDLDRIKLALQGYNYGSAYIDWAMERDGGYTKENAIAYSDMMCARPGWNYSIYGDKEYVDHVLRYYQVLNTGGTYPANGMQIPLYIQTEYSNIPYGTGSIADCGCGPTAFAMVARDVYKRQLSFHSPYIIPAFVLSKSFCKRLWNSSGCFFLI